MDWKPSNEPTRIDRRRSEAFDPVRTAVEALPLPPLRCRKPRGICNAIAMQIEDGGDSPEVNDLLLESLRASVIHQVGESAAAPVLRAIDTFRRAEAKRWEQVKAGILPPPPPPETPFEILMEETRQLMQTEGVREAIARPTSGNVLNELSEAITVEKARSSTAPPVEIVTPPAAVRPAARPPAAKPGRNDPCWCGSGKKYKRCHLSADQG